MAPPSEPSEALSFYDIAMRQPIASFTCSPNPWKSRFALNFKNVPYSTTWVQLPDIVKVRSGLGMDPCRKFGDGTDFYTLPILVDPNTNSKIGDSFDIAVYLQSQYPTSGSGDLFPPQKLDYVFHGDHAFLVDAAFTTHSGLMAYNLPFDPATIDAARAEFCRRVGVQSFDAFEVKGEAREKMKESFRVTLGDLAKLFTRDTSGPFILGEQASYADIIVGSWLRMMRVTLPEHEWEEARAWHGGVFGRLYDALEKYMQVK
ncbi:hypothetical protein BGZ73_006646 [Actinomortierella ambigua]|nr:hypothetical protein BGZ73_006646 [Actinomortierella ambigua]